MIDDAEHAARRAREMLTEISRDHAERFEHAKDRIHELKKEIADARQRFKHAVTPAHHPVFEHEVRAWAKRSSQPKQAEPEPAGPHVEPGRCDNCGRPNDEDVTMCASCGFALAVVKRAPRPTPAPVRRSEPTAKVDEEKPRKAGDKPPIFFFSVIGVALIGAFALADYIGTQREKHRNDDDDDLHPKKEKSAHEQTSGATTAVAIPSCHCMSPSDNPATEVKLLAPPSDRAQPWSVDIRRSFGALQRFALPEQAGAVLSGSSASTSPDVGIACDGNVFVLIANDRITAWSSSNATWKWNAALPKPFSAPHVAAPPPQGTSIATTCTQLDIIGDHVVVPLESGSANVSLADGHLASR